ncbi:MAG: glycosyltransferase family 2 protein [Myxococcales bacterium]|nr:glycosyltransferase family 2 protein [Myxococcales bacterium]
MRAYTADATRPTQSMTLPTSFPTEESSRAAAPASRVSPVISVVIPVYGGEKTIGPLVDGLRMVFERDDMPYEIIVVCDRPRDNSWAVVQELSRSRPELRAYRLQRNFGQHPATLFGLRQARGEYIATMDEDLQHSPEDVPALLSASREIGGIAFGKFEEPQHGLWRNLTSAMTKWFLARYVGQEIASNASAFRVFPSRLCRAFDHYRGERVAIDVLLSWSGAPIRTVPCPHAPRAAGHSGYTLRKLVAYLGDLLVGYSTVPLRMASLSGLVAVGLAAVIGVYVLVNWLRHGSAVPGFAFLAMAVAIFSGAQLLALGIIGEYLGRLYFNVLGKPQYFVAEAVQAGITTTWNPGVPSPSASNSESSPP